MKQPEPLKDADQIINDFTSACDADHAMTVFMKLYLANAHLRNKETIHPEAAWNVDPDEEKNQQAIKAISTMLYEIYKTLNVE